MNSLEMLIQQILLIFIIKEVSSYDFPGPYIRPEVAFQPRKISKFYNLLEGEWQDGEESFRVKYPTHTQIVSFCTLVYPDLDITNVRQGQMRNLSFCNFKGRDKCSLKQTVTWTCLSRNEQFTEPYTATPASTASESIDPKCYNETIHSIRPSTCTKVTVVWEHDLCSEYNLTMKKLNNVISCEIAETTDDDPGGVFIDGLMSADLQCCSKNWEADTNRQEETTLHNPFLPIFTEATFIHPTGHELPKEWCNFQEVEDKRDNITAKNLLEMKEIYTQLDSQDKKMIFEQISSVEQKSRQELVVLYSEHFVCLTSTVQLLLKQCDDLLDKHIAKNLKNGKSYRESIHSVNVALKEVNETFKSICERHLKRGDLSSEYKVVVRRIQELRLEADELFTKLELLENCVECFPIYTTKTPYKQTEKIPKNKPNENDRDESNLQTQYLIAIVSAVSCITILVALIFFILVVRRTLHKDRFTALPSADILTNEQYVTFLQKNGYANPTCRLPQKYLDDQD